MTARWRIPCSRILATQQLSLLSHEKFNELSLRFQLTVTDPVDTSAMKTLSLLHALDTRFLLWSSGHRNKYRVAYPARLLSRSGDGYIQVAIPCGAWLHGSDDARLLAARFAWAFAIERMLYFILKNGLKRRRPPECVPDFQSLVIPSDKFSFPSGHTSAAFLLAALIYDIAPWAGLGLFIWASGVGLSRVILGVHFPSDIAAGAALGMSVAATVPFLPYATMVM